MLDLVDVQVSVERDRSVRCGVAVGGRHQPVDRARLLGSEKEVVELDLAGGASRQEAEQRPAHRFIRQGRSQALVADPAVCIGLVAGHGKRIRGGQPFAVGVRPVQRHRRQDRLPVLHDFARLHPASEAIHGAALQGDALPRERVGMRIVILAYHALRAAPPGAVLHAPLRPGNAPVSGALLEIEVGRHGRQLVRGDCRAVRATGEAQPRPD